MGAPGRQHGKIKRYSRWLQLGLGLALSGLAGYLAVRELELQAVWEAVEQARLDLIGLATLLTFLSFVVKALRWRRLLGSESQSFSLLPLGLAHVLGQFWNMVLPARLGEIYRALVIQRLAARAPNSSSARSAAFLLGSVGIEKVLDLAFLGLLILSLLLFLPLPEWLNKTGTLFVVQTLIIVVVLLALTLWRGQGIAWLTQRSDRLPVWLHQRLISFFQSALQSLDVLQNGWWVLGLVAYTAIVWLLAVTINLITLKAVGLEPSWAAAQLVLVTLSVGIMLPAAPGRVGIFEYICILTLALFDINRTQALAFGILLHGIVLLPTVAVGLLAQLYFSMRS